MACMLICDSSGTWVLHRKSTQSVHLSPALTLDALGAYASLVGRRFLAAGAHQHQRAPFAATAVVNSDLRGRWPGRRPCQLSALLHATI